MTQEKEDKQGCGKESSLSGKDAEQAEWLRPLPEKLPKPTSSPAVLALGVCLLAFGIVTSWIISMVGLSLFLLGAGGWIARLRDE